MFVASKTNIISNEKIVCHLYVNVFFFDLICFPQFVQYLALVANTDLHLAHITGFSFRPLLTISVFLLQEGASTRTVVLVWHLGQTTANASAGLLFSCILYFAFSCVPQLLQAHEKLIASTRTLSQIWILLILFDLSSFIFFICSPHFSVSRISYRQYRRKCYRHIV